MTVQPETTTPQGMPKIAPVPEIAPGTHSEKSEHPGALRAFTIDRNCSILEVYYTVYIHDIYRHDIGSLLHGIYICTIGRNYVY